MLNEIRKEQFFLTVLFIISFLAVPLHLVALKLGIDKLGIGNRADLIYFAGFMGLLLGLTKTSFRWSTPKVPALRKWRIRLTWVTIFFLAPFAGGAIGLLLFN